MIKAGIIEYMNHQSKQTPVEGASSSTASSGDSIEPDNTSSPDDSQSPQAEANMRGLGSMNMKLFGYIPVESGLSRMLAPRPLVICGPSGTGKSTLLKKLMSEFSDCFGFSVSRKSIINSQSIQSISNLCLSIPDQIRQENQEKERRMEESITSRTSPRY